MSARHPHSPMLPALLCRRCLPEYQLSAAQRAELDAAERRRRQQWLERDRAKRELRAARHRLACLTAGGEPAPDSINGRIAAALRRKIVRLQGELT